MKIPEKYKEIYLRARQIDSELENQFPDDKILVPRRQVSRSVPWIIINEEKIMDLKRQINEKESEIEEAKKRIEEAKNKLEKYGIVINNITE